MKKNGLLLSLILIFMSNLTNAQNNLKIMGLYNLGSSSPEGGSHLFVLENGNYAIAYFGGIQTGKWEITDENNYKFSPNITESKFELYGRHNKDLEGTTKIFFNSFEKSETFIQLRTEDEEEYSMQRVFNVDANCFSHHYEYIFKTHANRISFMSIQHGDVDRKQSIITIKNTEGYNDFVTNFIEVDNYESQPFFAKFKDDKLHLEENDSINRIPLENIGEDLEFIKKFIEQEANKDTIYMNPSYNIFGQQDEEDQEDIHEFHVFNEQKNAFIDSSQYVEGIENIKSEESYEDMSIIYSYSLLKDYNKTFVKFKINEKSLFQVKCD